MSIDIRHITYGTKEGYYVRDTLNETITIYDTKEDIPKSIRHYAPDKKPRYWGPDIARIMGARKLLYPDFPEHACGLSGYEGKECVAESCKYIPNDGDWTKCPYFNIVG